MRMKAALNPRARTEETGARAQHLTHSMYKSEDAHVLANGLCVGEITLEEMHFN